MSTTVRTIGDLNWIKSYIYMNMNIYSVLYGILIFKPNKVHIQTYNTYYIFACETYCKKKSKWQKRIKSRWIHVQKYNTTTYSMMLMWYSFSIQILYLHVVGSIMIWKIIGGSNIFIQKFCSTFFNPILNRKINILGVLFCCD